MGVEITDARVLPAEGDERDALVEVMATAITDAADIDAGDRDYAEAAYEALRAAAPSPVGPGPEGWPSVDDVARVAREFESNGEGWALFSDEVRELGAAAFPEEIAKLATALHALYAPFRPAVSPVERTRPTFPDGWLGLPLDERAHRIVAAERALREPVLPDPGVLLDPELRAETQRQHRELHEANEERRRSPVERTGDSRIGSPAEGEKRDELVERIVPLFAEGVGLKPPRERAAIALDRLRAAAGKAGIDDAR